MKDKIKVLVERNRVRGRYEVTFKQLGFTWTRYLSDNVLKDDDEATEWFQSLVNDIQIRN